MRIIPAIDIIDGNAVRLEKGDFDKKKIYAKDPVEVAKSFQDAGLQYLHLVDLDGAKAGKVINQKLLERIKRETSMTVDYGGGIRTIKDVVSLKNAGADQVNIGSLSVKDPALTQEIIDTFGPEFIILSPDVLNGKIAINGWQEESQIDIMDYLEDYAGKGIKYFVCTDISKDGMLSGSSVDLYRKILEAQTEIKLIASGGVAAIDELDELIEIGLNGVIIGKAIYEGRISLKELEKYAV
jgi:phosphoribosylformimino-5-aminoimidazole carboxamide ribotide isomerase